MPQPIPTAFPTLPAILDQRDWRRVHASSLFIPMLGLLAPLRSRLSAGLAGSGSHGLFEISPSIGSQTFMREPWGRMASGDRNPAPAVLAPNGVRNAPGKLTTVWPATW